MADNRTMAQMLQAPIEGYEDAIVVPPINANNFELKQPLINLVQSNKFTGRQDPHNHLRFFNKVTSTFRHPEVPNTSIKLLLFPFSLDGEARDWLDKEPPRSILTWDDLVSKFINQFFPPSKTTYLRNKITNFFQEPNETFNEAWERFKGLLRQLSTDAPLSNSSPSNNSFEDKMTIKINQMMNQDKPNDKMTIKMNKMLNQMKALVVTPAPVKAVEEWSFILWDPHPVRQRVRKRKVLLTKDTELGLDRSIQLSSIRPITHKDKEPIEELLSLLTKPNHNLPTHRDSTNKKIREKDDMPSSKLLEIIRNLHFEIVSRMLTIHMPSAPLPSPKSKEITTREYKKILKVVRTKEGFHSYQKMKLPKSNLKVSYLSRHLAYALLEENNKLPDIISKDLSQDEKTSLINVLKKQKQAIAWKLSDIQGIYLELEFCSHKILLEDDYEPSVQHQRRVNPNILCPTWYTFVCLVIANHPNGDVNPK
ncbi:reverse transcriptase domain-containing protein [Tanacetum coccineum]